MVSALVKEFFLQIAFIKISILVIFISFFIFLFNLRSFKIILKIKELVFIFLFFCLI